MKTYRTTCNGCRRPQTSCMCKFCNPITTETRFVILMHPMERKKVKNGTGRLTYLQLSNSEIIEDVDFSNNTRVNKLLSDQESESFILYPGKSSINLSTAKGHELDILKSRKRVLFLIDATWACAKKMLKLSTNLHNLKMISFDNSKKSNFKIKQQPKPLCLSTIESTLEILKLFNQHKLEKCDTENFLLPFEKMIEYQISCTLDPHNNSYRAGNKKADFIKENYKNNGRNLFFN